MQSLIRQVVESMAKTLNESDFFKTSPKISALVEDRKDIVREIENAMQSIGAFCLVNFESSGNSDGDTPGPSLGDCSFNVIVSEIPSVWRSRQGLTPSSTEIGEAVARILHHHQPLDPDGVALSGGVLIFQSMKQQVNDSMMQQLISFTFPIYFPTTSPSR